MADIPRIVTPLGNIIMISDDDYAPNSTHNKNHYVYNETDNSTYISLKDGNTVAPTNDHVNWQILCKGMPGASDNNFTDAYKAKVDGSLQNWLKGKIINFAGDSVTWGYDPENSGARLSRPFPLVVGEMLGCTTNNYGVSGALLTGASGINIQVKTMDTNAAVNVVMGGSNDWANNIALGTISDTTNTTVYGALYVICNELITTYPNALNFLMTPPRRNDNQTNSNYSMEEIVNAIKCVARKYNFPVIDVYNGAPNLEPLNSTLKSKWMPDGLHPNQAYVEMFLSKKVAMSLLTFSNYGISKLSQGTLTVSDTGLTSSQYELYKDDNNVAHLALTMNYSNIAVGEHIVATLPDGFKISSIPKICGCSISVSSQEMHSLPGYIMRLDKIAFFNDRTAYTGTLIVWITIDYLAS